MTLSDEEKFALVVPVTSVMSKITGSKAMFALSFSTLLFVSDEKTGKIITGVNGVQNFRWMSV